MKTHILAILLLLLPFCSFAQEEKKKKELPELTHSGENVFACKVDGQLMMAVENNSEVIGDFGIKFSHSKSNKLMYISGSCTSPQYEIELSFPFNDTLGTYPLTTDYPYYTIFWDLSNSATPNATNQFQPDSTHTGSVNITYYDGNIIAGTFNYDAVNRNGKPVHVAFGRFDIATQQ